MSAFSLLAGLEQDLRSLSTEMRKKNQHIKDAIETAIMRIRTVAQATERQPDAAASELQKTADVALPFLLMCKLKSAKQAAVALASLQKMLSHGAFPPRSIAEYVDILSLLPSELNDETVSLKVLQSLLMLLTSQYFTVPTESLCECLVICFSLFDSKNTVLQNTAAATLRQVCTLLLDRHESEVEQQNAMQLLKDLNRSIQQEANHRLLSLELLDIVLERHHQTIIELKDFAAFVQETICPNLAKMFALSTTGAGDAALTVRTLRCIHRILLHFTCQFPAESGIFFKLISSLLESTTLWNRSMAVDVCRRLFDSPSFLRDVFTSDQIAFEGLCAGVCRCVMIVFESDPTARFFPASLSSKFAGLDAGGDMEGQVLSTSDLLKVALDAVTALSRSLAFTCHILYGGKEIENVPLEEVIKSTFDTENSKDVLMASQLLLLSWRSILPILSSLLVSSIDERLIQRILPCYQQLVHVAGLCKLDSVRDAFVSDLCNFTHPSSESVSPTTKETGMKMSAKNIQVLKCLFNIALCIAPLLGSSWVVILRNFRSLDRLLYPDAAQSVGAKGAASEGTTDDLAILTDALGNLWESTQRLPVFAVVDLLHALVMLAEEFLTNLKPAGFSQTSTRPRLFGIRGLFATLGQNVFRIDELWTHCTDHFRLICSFPDAFVRHSSVDLLVNLISTVLRSKTSRLEFDMILFYTGMFEAMDHPDSKVVFLNGINHIVQMCGQLLENAESWRCILQNLAVSSKDVESGGGGSRSADIIVTAFGTIQLVGNDCLPGFARDLVRIYIDILGVFSTQNIETNVSLSAMTNLWGVADFLTSGPLQNDEDLWILLFTRLRDCVRDARPSARNGALKTLLSSLLTHSQQLSVDGIVRCLREILHELLLVVEEETQRAYLMSGPSDGLGPDAIDNPDGVSSAVFSPKDRRPMKIMVHHSRNTVAKQWDETKSLAVSGVVRTLLAMLPSLDLDVSDMTVSKPTPEVVSEFVRLASYIYELLDSSILGSSGEVSQTCVKAMEDLTFSLPAEKTPQLFVDKTWELWVSAAVQAAETPGDAVTPVLFMLSDSWQRVAADISAHEEQWYTILEKTFCFCLSMDKTKRAEPLDFKNRKFFDLESRLLTLIAPQVVAGSRVPLLRIFDAAFSMAVVEYSLSMLTAFHDLFHDREDLQEEYITRLASYMWTDSRLYSSCLEKLIAFLERDSFSSQQYVVSAVVNLLRNYDGHADVSLETRMLSSIRSQRSLLSKVCDDAVIAAVCEMTTEGGRTDIVPEFLSVPFRPLVLRMAAYEFLFQILSVPEFAETVAAKLEEICRRVLEEYIASCKRLGKTPLPKHQRTEVRLVLSKLRGIPWICRLYPVLCDAVGVVDKDLQEDVKVLLVEIAPCIP